MKTSILILPLLTIGCLCSSEAESDVDEYLSVTPGGKVLLDCGKSPDKWTLTVNQTEEILGDDDHYELTDDERKLTIVDIQEPQNGVYKCLTEDNTVIKTFDVDSKFKLNKLAKSQSVDDGVPTEIECSLKSEGQDVVFNWFSIPEGADPNNANVERTKICSKGSSCSADGGKAEKLFDSRDKSIPIAPFDERTEIVMSSEEGIPKSTLKFSPAYNEDRQIYICQAVLKGSDAAANCAELSNKDCDETHTLLRVKDPLAALYPFVGIVAEVILLCIIIFFCEKSKSDTKEDYDEVAGNGNSSTGSNSNLRQRK